MDPKIAFFVALVAGFAIGLIAGSVVVAIVAIVAGIRSLFDDDDEQPAPLPEPEPEPKPAPAMAALTKVQWEAEFDEIFEKVWRETW